MRSPTKHKHGLVAILDALGAAAYGPTEIDRFMDSRDVVLRLAQEKAEEMLEVNLMSTFTFNDTIVFALEAKAERPRIEEVSGFFLLLRKFMVDSLKNGILLRGSIAVGTFYAARDTNTVMGEAARANWIGIHATPRATIILNGLLDAETKKRSHLMVDYTVPMKDGRAVTLKVVNWPKALFVPGLVSESMRTSPRAMALDWFGRQPIPNGAEDKCFNAITFFDEIVRKQKLGPQSPSGASKGSQ